MSYEIKNICEKDKNFHIAYDKVCHTCLIYCNKKEGVSKDEERAGGKILL